MTNPNDPSTSPAAARPPLKERLKSLLADYGRLALWVYFAIFFACIIGFAVALRLGFQVQGAEANSGPMLGVGATLVAAWAATKVTQPVRILATLALTPALERGLRVWPRLHRLLTGRQ